MNTRFRELYPDIISELELSDVSLIRSEKSCRVDILKWGAKWDKNTNRPYFEGHEKDVANIFLIGKIFTIIQNIAKLA